MGGEAPAAARGEGEEEVKLYLFTWNVGSSPDASNLVSQHLARQCAKQDPWIACLQELPARSWIAEARRSSETVGPFPDVRVVPLPDGGRLPKGLALLHDRRLDVLDVRVDEDGEFIAAQIEHAQAGLRFVAVGVHAKAKVDMPAPQDHGGSRALLRHAINHLPWATDPKIILGDFNSALEDVEMSSWHCFYALHDHQIGLGDARRRGIDHVALRVVSPRNSGTIGTFVHKTSGSHAYKTIDYFVVDARLRTGAEASILPSLEGEPLLQLETNKITISDHLPVEGAVHL